MVYRALNLDTAGIKWRTETGYQMLNGENFHE